MDEEQSAFGQKRLWQGEMVGKGIRIGRRRQALQHVETHRRRDQGNDRPFDRVERSPRGTIRMADRNPDRGGQSKRAHSKQDRQGQSLEHPCRAEAENQPAKQSETAYERPENERRPAGTPGNTQGRERGRPEANAGGDH